MERWFQWLPDLQKRLHSKMLLSKFHDVFLIYHLYLHFFFRESRGRMRVSLRGMTILINSFPIVMLLTIASGNVRKAMIRKWKLYW